MSLPTLSPPPILMCPDVGIPTFPAYISLDESLSDVGPLSGVTRQRFYLSWGSSPRSPRQTVGLSQLPPCKKFRRSRVITSPDLKS